MNRLTLLAALLWACGVLAQEQIDRPDGPATVAVPATGSVRVRVKQVTPAPPSGTVQIEHGRGGEVLGGAVTRANFTSADRKPDLAIGEWSAPLPLAELFGKE